MKTGKNSPWASASLQRSWVARSAFALGLFLCVTSAHADAELPKESKIAVDQVPASVMAVIKPACESDDIYDSQKKWSAYRVALDKRHTAYFIQCTYAGSNDMHYVAIEGVDGKASLARFQDKSPIVYNVRPGDRPGEIIDISGNGAACAHELRWQWRKTSFKLTKSITHGCKG